MVVIRSLAISVTIAPVSACALSPTGPDSAASRAVKATLSPAKFTETGGEALLQLRASSSSAWQVTLPDWLSTTAPLFGVGNADISLSVGRSNADRSAAVLVNEARVEVVQQVAIRISATCFSGRPGELVLLACTAFLSRHRSGVPYGRIWAGFSAMGQTGRHHGPYTAGNADWDFRIPASQPVGKVTIPIHLEYGDGFTATARPEFTVLPR